MSFANKEAEILNRLVNMDQQKDYVQRRSPEELDSLAGITANTLYDVDEYLGVQPQVDPVLDMIQQANQTPVAQYNMPDINIEADYKAPDTPPKIPPVVAPEVPTQPKAPSKLDSILERMKALQDNSKIKEAQDNAAMGIPLTAAMRGFERMGAGMAGGSVSQVKPDYSNADMIQKNLDRLLKTAKDDKDLERQGIKDEIASQKLPSEMDLIDPDSDASKMLREEMKKVGVSGDFLKGMSYSQMKTVLPTMVNRHEAKLARESKERISKETLEGNKLATQAKNKDKDEQKIKDTLYKMAKDARNDKVVLDMDKRFSKLNTARELLATQAATGNAVATNSIKALVALTFESGRLTDEDVERYTRKPDLLGSAQRALSLYTKGTFDKATTEELQALFEVIEDTTNNNKGKVLRNLINSNVRVLGEDGEGLRERITDSLDPSGFVKNHESDTFERLAENKGLDRKKINNKPALVDKSGKMYHPYTGKILTDKEYENIYGVM